MKTLVMIFLLPSNSANEIVNLANAVECRVCIHLHPSPRVIVDTNTFKYTVVKLISLTIGDLETCCSQNQRKIKK